MGRVIIGVDPHKLSATIEVLDDRERVLGQGRFGTHRGGYRQMLAMARRWPERTWAVEGSQGIGRHVAQRLVADGEAVVDVPAKLSAWARVFSTGQGRKTDATDARCIAVVALRTAGLQAVAVDGDLVALRLLADRRDELAGARTRTVSRLHRLLLELIPAGAPRFLSAARAKALLATGPPAGCRRPDPPAAGRRTTRRHRSTGPEAQGQRAAADRSGERDRHRSARHLWHRTGRRRKDPR